MIACQRFELENQITPLASADEEALYVYDKASHDSLVSKKPWLSE